GGIPPVRGEGSSGERRPGGGEPAAGARRRRRAVPLVLGVAAAVLLGVAAVFVVRVQTDRGELVIRSSDPGVQVLVKHGGEPVEDWELKQGENRTSVRSGDYEVLLIGDTDGLSVRDGAFTLTRGGRQVVTIERTRPALRPVDDPDAPSGMPAPIVADDPDAPEPLRIELGRERSIKIGETSYSMPSLVERINRESPGRALIAVEPGVPADFVENVSRLLWRANVEHKFLRTSDIAESEAAADPRAPRYGGKTYAEAKRLLQTERKPEVVAEAIEAVAALVDQGGYRETLRLILQAARHHGDPWTRADKDRALVQASTRKALENFDSPEGVEAMNAALVEGESNDRAYLLGALSGKPRGSSIRQISRENAVRAVPGMLAASHDPDGRVSTSALQIAAELAPEDGSVVSRLRELLVGEDAELVHTAAILLAGIDPQTEGLATVLESIVFSEGRTLDLALANDAELLARVNPDAEGLTMLLAALVHQEGRPDRGRDWEASGKALTILSDLGPKAAEAVPRLVSTIQDGSSYRYVYPAGPRTRFETFSGGGAGRVPGQPLGKSLGVLAIEALGSIGPAANAAVPVLRSIVAGTDSPTRAREVREAAAEALRKITRSEEAPDGREPGSATAPAEPGTDPASAEAAAELRRSAREAQPPHYGGKTYAEAERLLKTERRPEIIADAIEALAALADVGGYYETLRLILDAARQRGNPWTYSDEGSGLIRLATRRGVEKFDSPEGAEAMNRVLVEGHTNDRAYILNALTRKRPGSFYKQISPKNAVVAIPGILAAIDDEDLKVSTTAIHVAAELAPDDERVRSRLRKALSDERSEVNYAAATALAEVDPKADGLSSVLEKVVFREGRPLDPSLAYDASLLARVDPDSEALLNLLLELVSQSRNAWVRGSALTTLAMLGPKAGGAVPALVQIVDDEESSRQSYIPLSVERSGGVLDFDAPFRPKERGKSLRALAIEALGSIGPAASDALPVLRKFAEEEVGAAGVEPAAAVRDAQYRRAAAVEAIRKITGSEDSPPAREPASP
ncbi:MAG TPA: hypothetical protein VML55_00465, partial [Planctomycetaceae bacterium]|nr:hypothetical protein [Planctomycetaceae bacterium]